MEATPGVAAGNNPAMLRTDALDYDLPDDLVATRPSEPRDAARLLVVDRNSPGDHEERRVRELPEFLRAGDLLVFNDSRVLPARLSGVRRSSGGRISGLFLSERPGGLWAVLLKSNGRLRAGDVIDLIDAHGATSGCALTLGDRANEGWLAEASTDSEEIAFSTARVLARVGATPLPPYILGARQRRSERYDDDHDREWYQTVYAQDGEGASVAAPTAGLHFTPGLLDALRAMGVRTARVTLHVGAGTFKPIETETVDEHPIHAEWAEVSAETLRAVRETNAAGGRVICVGTTSARALESVPPEVAAGSGNEGWLSETRLLITPGYEWKYLNGVMTNFHLPRSTLLAMVGALFPGGVGDLLGLYGHAVREGFRFYSYGDAMLILPDALGGRS